MINIVFYLLISYLGMFLVITKVARWGRRRWEISPKRRKVLISLVVVLLALPPMPYAVVEGLTHIYAKSVLPAVHQAMHDGGYVDQIRNLKVLSISPSRATVYVVTPCEPGGGYRACTVQLLRTRGEWRYLEDSERIVWADGGSADSNIFPPYPSVGDYHKE